ncbi:Serine/threonine-protein kinase PrkC [Stieleria neptunia]|uniref:Serine/threonine-protein kinase PrkC n=1 Tax=Stieleria neptunia TaxID=2527979 RepID=A0A518HS79_9BACT|nr:protein kinase [Stieleria neptunia]QDV43705.1 Serine/threonine-protein kinase PrkC [Stieleria neptunia]
MIGPNPNRSTFVPIHRNQSDRLARTSCNISDKLQLSLQRLEATGAFDSGQIRLIEEEYAALWNSEDSFHHISLLQPGDQIEHFVIDQLLGCGGEAHVFRAHESGTGKVFAIKVLHNARTSERFHREMKMVQQVAHPNIVTAYEVGTIHGMPYIAMELMQGPDLNALIADSGPIDWRQSSAFVLQIVRALAHAHCRELVHRDIKPGNIILNGGGQVKLVDLGLASMRIGSYEEETRSINLTGKAQIAGTLPYMAPEQAKSLSKADLRSDIYSLGATWFYLLTGKIRVRGKTFSRQYRNLVAKRRFRDMPADSLPPNLHQVFSKMVAYDRRQRYQSCLALEQDLERALEDLGQNVTSHQLSVLIVEDSQSDMLLAVELLKMANDSLMIHQATSLSEGIKIQAEHHVDLVFLDLTLPDSAGVATVEQFRAQHGEVPIVVLTGLSDEQVAEACVSAGATDFISKDDLTAHKLERVIFVTFSRHASLDE